MQIVALTGNDTVVIGGQLFTDFGPGVIAELKFNNDLVQVQRGKNGNTVYALNNQGFQSEFTVRLLLGGPGDAFLNAQMAAMKNNFAGYSVLDGLFVKNVGDGKSNIKPVTYLCGGGVIKKMPEQKSVSEGDPTQSMVEWSLIFANNDRGVG